MDQFLVLSLRVKWNYGDAVGQLEPKRVRRIIDQEDVFQIAIANNAQIFDVDSGTTTSRLRLLLLVEQDGRVLQHLVKRRVVNCLVAVLSVQAELNKAPLRIHQLVNHRIRILPTTSGEYANLVARRALRQTLAHVGPQVDAGGNLFPADF